MVSFFLFILNLGHIVSPASNTQPVIGQHNVWYGQVSLKKYSFT